MNHRPTKEELEFLYVEQSLTMKQVAMRLCISAGLVHKLIHAYGITPRPRYKGMKGKHQSAEVRNTISKANKGKRRTPEERRKMSERAKNKTRKPSQFGGHIKILRNGYREVYLPSHPNAHKDGYALEHVVAYGVYHDCVVDTEKYAIHHINGIKTDNRAENLVMMTKSEHMSYHSKIRHESRRVLCKNFSQSET